MRCDYLNGLQHLSENQNLKHRQSSHKDLKY